MNSNAKRHAPTAATLILAKVTSDLDWTNTRRIFLNQEFPSECDPDAVIKQLAAKRASFPILNDYEFDSCEIYWKLRSSSVAQYSEHGAVEGLAEAIVACLVYLVNAIERRHLDDIGACVPVFCWAVIKSGPDLISSAISFLRWLTKSKKLGSARVVVYLGVVVLSLREIAGTTNSVLAELDSIEQQYADKWIDKNSTGPEFDLWSIVWSLSIAGPHGLVNALGNMSKSLGFQ